VLSYLYHLLSILSCQRTFYCFAFKSAANLNVIFVEETTLQPTKFISEVSTANAIFSTHLRVGPL